MNQAEKRVFLIRSLLDEQPRYRDMDIPSTKPEQRQLLRSLFNIRMPAIISDSFLKVQDEYLQEKLRRKGITELSDLTPIETGVVTGYKAVESAVVGTYKKIEDKFVDQFLKKDGETVEEAKKRLKK